MKILSRFFLSLFLFGCHENSKSVLPPEKIGIILWELAQADVFTQEFIAKDSSTNLEQENLKLQLKIFIKNKTDRQTFYRSYDHYLKHEELLKPLLDSIVVKNGRIRENMRLNKIIKPTNEQVK